MSIRSLLTENVKSSQNLNVNSINAKEATLETSDSLIVEPNLAAAVVAVQGFSGVIEFTTVAAIPIGSTVAVDLENPDFDGLNQDFVFVGNLRDSSTITSGLAQLSITTGTAVSPGRIRVGIRNNSPAAYSGASNIFFTWAVIPVKLS